MIRDVTGIELIPGNNGEDCPGNGNHIDSSGMPIECCCDECNYFCAAWKTTQKKIVKKCLDKNCPRRK